MVNSDPRSKAYFRIETSEKYRCFGENTRVDCFAIHLSIYLYLKNKNISTVVVKLNKIKKIIYLSCKKQICRTITCVSLGFQKGYLCYPMMRKYKKFPLYLCVGQGPKEPLIWVLITVTLAWPRLVWKLNVPAYLAYMKLSLGL